MLWSAHAMENIKTIRIANSKEDSKYLWCHQILLSGRNSLILTSLGKCIWAPGRRQTQLWWYPIPVNKQMEKVCRLKICIGRMIHAVKKIFFSQVYQWNLAFNLRYQWRPVGSQSRRRAPWLILIRKLGKCLNIYNLLNSEWKVCEERFSSSTC